VRARVAFVDPVQAAGAKRLGEILIMADGVQVPRHLGSIARHQEILSRAEQAFLVLPGRADQGYAAGQRFEHADRWDPRQGLHVRPAGNMNGHSMLGEGRGRLGVGKPALVGDAGGGQRIKRLSRIADAVDGAVKTGLTGGFDQEIVQLLRAFAIAPVADPNKVFLPALGNNGRNTLVSAASCQVKTRRPQPSRS
jgi:hypothetical protein